MQGPHALTIDLDGAWCYRAIHGEEEGGEAGDDVVLFAGVPRFLDLCERLDRKATLFVVGRDLDNDRYARLIERAHVDGHAIESHSNSHDYALCSYASDRCFSDVSASVKKIVDVTGRVPSGFRAPGYNLSAALLDGVKRAGLAWSSSILPSPAYFVARVAVIAKTRLRGKRSASLVGRPRDFTLRRARHANGLLEFPMSAPWGVPFTGTTLALLPDVAAAALAEEAAEDAGAMLELHAADFVDGSVLPVGQPDRSVRLSDKLRRIENAVRRLPRTS